MTDAVPDRLLKRAAVLDLTGLATTTIYKFVKSPDPAIRFPPPVKLGPRAARWSERAVLDWIDRQKARSAQAIA